MNLDRLLKLEWKKFIELTVTKKNINVKSNSKT